MKRNDMKRLVLCWAVMMSLVTQAQQPETICRNSIRIGADDTDEVIIEKAAHVVPTPNQLAALQNEFIAFVHLGPNTFTRMEWGSGLENPSIFDLKELDTDQWCSAMKAAGMKIVILTAKHHDGFVLWQSRYTTHGIMSTGYKDGKGDIMKELSESCRKYGLKLGIYLSPADLYQIESPDGLYGNLSPYTLRTIPREIPGRPFSVKTRFQFEVDDYNEYFLNQLFELLTEYGPIHEVWFDGAHPKTKGGQKYNYEAWRELIRTLAPDATIFGREDIRWCGNEAGNTRTSEWNVIASYTEDPTRMVEFMDLHGDLGSREVLLKREKPYYLHYQPAETNTSIREGWFYRDDIHQQTRSADDVFDIYERSVGGNSIFLLNIPPNREGRFSKTDVAVLEETGKRIQETYGENLLKNATGPKEVLDGDEHTFIVLDKESKEIIVSVPQPITFNRIMIQEAIATHSERVEKHAVDVWTDRQWKEVAQATNIGYKRILRFPDVTASKIRVRISDSRLSPAISHISAHYYQKRPPILSINRTADGQVSIFPQKSDFNWFNGGNKKSTQEDKQHSDDYQIYYTTDGSEPDKTSQLYTVPFPMGNGEVKAVAFLQGKRGAVSRERFGLVPKNWKIMEVSETLTDHPASAAFDACPDTYWMASGEKGPFIFCIDLGKTEYLTGFAYTPPTQGSPGLITQGTFEISRNGKRWKKVEDFKFGNLLNDPTKRYHYFKQAVKGRYIRIIATEITPNDKTASMAELDIF